MAIALTIRDETAAGAPIHELSLEFLTERITVRELIRSRVYQEVKDHNVRERQTAQGLQSPFRGLVEPEGAERTLNGVKLRTPREIDWKRQFAVAEQAFQRNGFLILIDERQATSLEEEIEIRPGTTVSFVKLTPLVGG